MWYSLKAEGVAEGARFAEVAVEIVGIAGRAQAIVVFVLPFGGKTWTTLGPHFWQQSGCAWAVFWRALAHTSVC